MKLARLAGAGGDESGSILLEFALFASFWSLMLFGIFDYAMFISEAIDVQNAAVVGASWGAAAGNENAGNVMTLMASTDAYNLPNFQTNENLFYTCTAGGSPVSAGTSCASGIKPMAYITVTTSATAAPAFRFKGITTTTLHGSATFRVIN
jgi:Flp pilus assembly protein TadG